MPALMSAVTARLAPGDRVTLATMSRTSNEELGFDLRAAITWSVVRPGFGATMKTWRSARCSVDAKLNFVAPGAIGAGAALTAVTLAVTVTVGGVP